MKKVMLIIATLALLVSCTNPFVVKSAKTASVTVNIASEQSTTVARTIMPDFATSADSYKITLESNGVPPFATKTVTIDTTVSTYTFPSVETGSWNITIDALKSGAVIASGKLLNKTLETEGLTASIILNPVINSGTGDFSFKFQFPASLGVTKVSCTLYDASGTVVIPGTDNLNLSGSTDIIATFTNTDFLPSGSYSIVTNFLSNSIDIGSFRELVNIFPNTVSNKWIQADGTLTDRRVFKSEEFGSANTDLVNFEIEGLNSSQFQFASAITSYTIYDIPSESFRIKATESVPGQKISFTWNAIEPLIIASGSYSRPLALNTVDNALTVIVVASGGGTPKNYTINIKKQPTITSTSVAAMQMVKVPAGTFQRDSTVTNTSYVSSFYMGKYEVSQAQYQAVMGANPSSSTTSLSHVVDGINLYRAITFCNKLSLSEGLTPVYSVIKNGNEIDWSGIIHENIPTISDAAWNAVVMNVSANGYRLPTEMEWRWAAMGATKDARSGDIVNEVNVLGYTKGYAGSTEAGSLQVNIGNYAWYQSNSGVGGTITDPRTIQPVGTKLPNELGIYDLSGNVWEWCWDVFANYPLGNISNYTGSYTERSASSTCMFISGGFDDGVGAQNVFPLGNRLWTNRPPQDGPTAVGFRVARNSEKLAMLYTANQDGSMSAYKVIEKNGGLVKLANYNKGADTNALYAVTVHPNRKYLYAIGRDGSNNSSIYVYTINPLAGDLVYVSGSAKVTGSETCQILIDPTGNYLYTCNTQSKDISIFKIALDGTLTIVGQNFSLGLSGSIPLRMAMTLDGKYLYTANYSESADDENLSMLKINTLDGTLFTIPGSPLEVSTKSANNLIISPDGKYLYVSEYNGCIEQFEINADGSLISKQILTGTGWQNYLYIDPSARFLYFCAYGFYGVARNTSTGTMTYLKGTFANSLQTEKDGLLVFAPYGSWAYSNTTNAIELLSHNTVSGALQFVRNISTTEQVNDLVSMYLY